MKELCPLLPIGNNKECRELIQKLEQTLRENERLLEEQRRIGKSRSHRLLMACYFILL